MGVLKNIRGDEIMKWWERIIKQRRIKAESGGPDRRRRSYLQTKSMAVRTRGRQSWRASMDGGPTGAEDCVGSGPVGLEVRIGVRGQQ